MSECQPPIPMANDIPSTANNLLTPIVSSSTTCNSLCSSYPSSLLNQTNIVPLIGPKFIDLPTEPLPFVLVHNTSTCPMQ
ncbi:hypothetical protein TNIN_76121 [Trichonephila inaurata madagascariensis]|uniref:Uncharacterized protein n=1 Tax=Trichonephila inaurata madagascariensis TaxID=2747483 RepID=A0A8X6XD28_9ARAC|nr:hypothetical protein TNIN_76121 [Trichonephila inaurata madagascariensis]